jgi:hypothetical protein
MSGFLYFVSGEQRPPSTAKLAEWRLAYAFPKSPSHRSTMGGPNGKSGSVLVDSDRQGDKKQGYFPDEQTWRKLPAVAGRPETWLGYWNDAKPTPADLLRADALPGEASIKLGDGHRWQVPTLCEFDHETQTGECALPAALDFNDDGELFATKPDGEYGALWDAVHPVALGLCFGVGDMPAPSEKQIRDAAIALLATNYHVSMVELATLGALRNDGTSSTVVLAATRGKWLIDALAAVAKKNDTPPAATNSDTPDGEAA